MKNIVEQKGSIEIQTWGAVEGHVTGSKYGLYGKNFRVLIDCGLFQGKDDERSPKGERRNFTPTELSARGVTEVLLSHVHIDHSGNLPTLFRDGFTPRILTTEITARFLGIMLQNSAEIQSAEHKENRLYTLDDVRKTMSHLKIVESFTQIPVGQKHSEITAEFVLNGHIEGACSILLRIRGERGKHNILFTGDMGKRGQSLCGGYEEWTRHYPQESVHTLVVESTNFLNEPISFRQKKENLFTEIREVWRRGGNPLLPVLSMHRFQEIIEMLHNSGKELDPGEDFMVVLDAPLAMKLLREYKSLSPSQLSRRYGDDPNFYRTDKDSLSRFELKHCRIIESHDDSILASDEYANYCGKAIILASGGMVEHGRSQLWYRGSFCENPKNEVILTCFQVPGTRGEALLHDQMVRNGRERGARVKKIEGFTSHISGPEETFKFLGKFNLGQLRRVIITHGKDNARQAMAEEFRRRGYEVDIFLPRLKDRIALQ